MIEPVSLDAVIAQTREALKPYGLSASTHWQHEYAWRQFHQYCLTHGWTNFSVRLAEQYVLELHDQYEQGTLRRWKFNLFRKGTALLVECFGTNTIKWGHLPHWHPSPFSSNALPAALDQYRRLLEDSLYGRGTKQLYSSVAKLFLQYVEQVGGVAVEDVTLAMVSQFVPHAATHYQPTSMRTVLSALRHFLRFAQDDGMTAYELVNAVPKSFGRKSALVPTLTNGEERQLLAAFDRNTALGKRDFAIVLLALHLGLRSIDITHLLLADIDWRKNKLSLVQQKTGRRLETPLLTEVGNALIDYLLHGRPASTDPQVFLRSQAPHIPLSEHGGIGNVVRAAMKRAGIRQKPGERRGPHTLRHSLAARLLAAETPLPVISSVLGHGHKDTTRVYLSTDTEHLRACALGLEGIEFVGEGWR